MRIHQFLLYSLIFLLVACSEENIETNMSEEIQDFEFKTQDNETFGLSDLKGKWWLADFMYTNCNLVCPTMTSNMVRVQLKLKEVNLANKIEIISFTVDPDYDKPEILKEYAKSYQADLSNWTFLTGYQFETIKELSIGSFKTMLQEGSPENENDLIAHGTSFFLVNPQGELIKKYDGMGPEQIDEIISDLRKVL